MNRQLRTLGIVMATAMLLASCGDNDNTIIIGDNDNTNTRTATPVVTPTSAATPTSALTPTSVEETPTEVAPTSTPGPGETATPVATGPTSTPAPGATATTTPAPVATATHTPTPTPTTTAAAGPSCGNSIKEAGEECDTGATFGISADCAGECACCICRPNNTQHALGLKCGTCHPGVAPIPAFPPGAAETFPGLCE